MEVNKVSIGSKRRYDSSFRVESSFLFQTPRHNLLQDFDRTPTKEVKAPDAAAMKASFSKFLSPEAESVSSLKKDMRLKDADVISLKANILQLENNLSSAGLAARYSQIEQEKNIAKLRAEKDYEGVKLNEFRSKLQYVMEKQKSSHEECNRLEQDMVSLKRDMDKKLAICQREKREAENLVHTWRSKCHKVESEFQAQLSKQKRDVLHLAGKCEEMGAQLSLKEKCLQEMRGNMGEVKDWKEQIKELQDINKCLKQQLSDHEDDLVVTRAFKSDLDKLPKMKCDLEKLKADNENLRYNEQNCLLLEEELRSLKKKLECAESRNEKLTEMEEDNEELKGRLYRWESYDTSGSRRPQSPSSLSQRVNELEMSQVTLTLKGGELQTQINSLTMKLEHAHSEKIKLSSQVNSERNTVEQNNELIKRFKRKLLLVTKERDSYKGLLDSYESEVTMNYDAERLAHQKRQEETLVAYRRESETRDREMNQMSLRLADLQTMYDQAHQQLQLKKSSGPSKHVQETIRELREKVVELEIQLAKISEENNILDARIEERHLQGDYDPSKTKVIHLTTNPCSIAQQTRQAELTTAQEEVDKLRKRNQILEEHGGRVEDLTEQVQEKLQQPSPSKEVEVLRSDLKREGTRNKRLMEVFKKTSREFRDICYQLTGYKIDIPAANQYRVSSMYAESSKDYLLFQQNEQGEIQMLETDYSTTLKDAMERYLKQQHSIPVFLSSITMDLFSVQTMQFIN